MKPMDRTPPKLCTAFLLRSLGSRGNAEEVAGDLHEEFVHVAEAAAFIGPGCGTPSRLPTWEAAR
jgi:hypothetical protein